MWRSRKVLEAGAFMVPLVIVAALLQIAVGIGVVDSALVPSPWSIGQAIVRLSAPQPLLLSYLLTSLYRLLTGFIFGGFVGVALGVLLGSSTALRNALKPVLDFLISVPTICWVPLLLISVGVGDATVIIAVFLGCVFPVTYSAMNGVRSAREELVWGARSMGASSARVLRSVLLPAALPTVITGLRLAVGYSWRALIGAEMLAAAGSGIGYMIYAARAFYDVDVMFAGLVVIALAGLAMDYLVMGSVERRTVQRWGMVTKTW